MWGVTTPGLIGAVTAAARDVYPLWNYFGRNTSIAAGDSGRIRRLGVLQLGVITELNVLAMGLLYWSMGG